MTTKLYHWLTEHRETLLPRWASALHSTMGSVNGDGTIEPSNDGNVATETISTDVLGTVSHVYDGLIQAAHGNLSVLDEYLQAILYTNGHQNIKLPELIQMPSHFRHLAWDIFQHDMQNPVCTFTLMKELDTLLEHAVGSLAQYWEKNTEAEIQDRISQAEFIAESMATAIEQADRLALQFSSLNMASQRLAANLENIEQLIDHVGATLLELIGPSHISIWLPENTEKPGLALPEAPAVCLQIVRSWGENDHSVADIQTSDLAEEDIVFRSYHNSIMVCDYQPDETQQGMWYQPNHGVLALPLLVKEKASGVIVMQDNNPEERFSRSQQELARALVSQAAIAIENARLYDQILTFNSELEQLVERRTSELQAEKDRLATVHEIATEISSTLDLDTLLQTSLNALARITNVEYGSIMLMESDTGHLVNRAVLGQREINTFTRFPIGTGVAGWVAQHKKSVVIDNISQDERWIPLPAVEQRNEGSMVAAPLIAHNEVLGVLILSHSKPNFFNADHQRLLSASAGAIAIGINNANMYNTIFSEMERNSELLHRQNMETTKMEAILQSLSDGVLVCDLYGEIITANPAAGRILQRDIEELLFLGTTMYDVLNQLLGKRIQEMPLNELLSNPLLLNEEARVFESTVEVHMRVIGMTLGPVLKGSNELIGALLLMHDITREVEAERLKTEFIGTMSHELRTPMTAIKGFTQLLGMGGLGPVNDTQREFLNTIQNNAERMISMINDVLDITKIETGSIDLELRPIHLAESLSGVVSELQGMVKNRNHILTISIPTGLPLVRADTSRLHQILQNLLTNAIKYTPQGGNIWIEAREVVRDELPEHIRHRLTKDKRYVQMDIRDTGVGIAEHELEVIFDRFYRTENRLKIEAGGTGLGLSLVKPLIELHGGCIWVKSVLEEGSTFSFVLPAVL